MVEKENNYEVYIEIYSTQFSSEDPVCMEDVTSVDEVLSMIESIPVEDYMLVDLYMDICDVKDPIYQESYSILGCRNLDSLKEFVSDVFGFVKYRAS